MFGDAFSPYLIGALSDSFKPLIASSPVLDPYGSAVTLRQSTMMDRILTYELTPQEYDREFRALEYSLFSCCFFQVSPLSPLHNVYIVQFFSPRPSAVGLREHLPKKKMFSFGHCPNEGGGRTLPELKNTLYIFIFDGRKRCTSCPK